MKKKVIRVIILVTGVVGSFILSLNFQNSRTMFLSLNNIEALSADETKCVADDMKNSGLCKASADGSGYVCIESTGHWEIKDCYKHETVKK